MSDTPRIIDPIPSRRPLPLMQSIHDDATLNTRERTTFYVSAFLFQVRIAELSLANAAQIAEQPDPAKRSFQSGSENQKSQIQNPKSLTRSLTVSNGF
jgi:hypothetical protein